MLEPILVSHPGSRALYPKRVNVVNGYIEIVKCGDVSPLPLSGKINIAGKEQGFILANRTRRVV